MSVNHLYKAKIEKNDEFYTLLPNIEAECGNYEQYFKNKTIYCNCDDPHKSNFFKYFHNNFNRLGLKRLICSCFSGNRYYFLSDPNKKAYIYDSEIGQIEEMRGDGSFLSKESIALLDQADIVVTNPPFSLFQLFINQLMEKKKQFLIIGDMNKCTSKNMSFWLVEDQIRLGVNSGVQAYESPSGLQLFNNSGWFTNLPVPYRWFSSETKYVEGAYEKISNFDAINIPNLKALPIDYTGRMGVPITFLKYHNPEQYKLLGFMFQISKLGSTPALRRKSCEAPMVNEKRLYARAYIQKI